MKFRWNWDWHPMRPYNKVCDELCNPVLLFCIPLIGYLWVHLPPKRRYEDGYWYSSGSRQSPDGQGVISFTTCADDRCGTVVRAEVPAEAEEIEALWDDDHPEVWRDREVFERATLYEIFTGDPDHDESDVSVIDVCAVLARDIRRGHA